MSSTETTSSTLADRLVAEAVRLAEEFAGHPFDDVTAERAGRAAGGGLERRILARAAAMPMAGGVRATLSRLRGIGVVVVAVAMLLALLAGAGAVSTVLADPTRPVSLLWMLGLLVGPNLFMLIVWLLLLLTARRGGGGGGRLLVSLGQRLGARMGGADGGAALAATGAYLHPSGPGRWWLGTLSHGLWLVFAVAVLATLLVHLSTRQFDFVWETTLLAPSQVADVVRAVSTPVKALGLPAPGRGPFAGGPMAPVADSAAQRRYWAQWLLAVITVYALLPRLILTLVCLGLARRNDARYRLDLSRPGYARLQHRLAPDGADYVVDADPGVVVESELPVRPLPVGLPLCTVAVEVEGTGWPPAVGGRPWHDLGRADDGPTRRAVLEGLTSCAGAGAVVVACSATATPDAGTRRFLVQARNRSQLPLGLVLLNGADLSRRGERARGVRVADWRSLARAVGAAGGDALVLEGDGSEGADQRRLAAWLVRGGTP